MQKENLQHNGKKQNDGNRQQNENKMGVMPVPKLVITMSFPIMVSMLVQSLYNIVDSIFVARISEDALTATSITYSAQMLQIAAAVGTGVGVNALISRCLGAKQFDKANEAATTGLLLTVLSSLFFVLWGIFGTEAFVRQFSTGETITRLGTEYLQICQIFSTGLFLGTLTQRLLQATGRTFFSMLAQMAGAAASADVFCRRSYDSDRCSGTSYHLCFLYSRFCYHDHRLCNIGAGKWSGEYDRNGTEAADSAGSAGLAVRNTGRSGYGMVCILDF